ncbi:MAG: hypothetical protein F6K39_35875 [Okeania sp. SIO3B3]|nr:hypothetical protein [Okeania sp. SIO3B3]
MNYKYINSESQLNESFNELKKSKLIGIDTETTGLDPFTSKLLLLQVGTPEVIYVYDLVSLSKDKFSELGKIFKSNNYLKIMHNAYFDIQMLKFNFKFEFNRVFDTMIAERILNYNQKCKSSLKYVSKKYLNINMDKTIRESFQTQNSDVFDEEN